MSCCAGRAELARPGAGASDDALQDAVKAERLRKVAIQVEDLNTSVARIRHECLAIGDGDAGRIAKLPGAGADLQRLRQASEPILVVIAACGCLNAGEGRDAEGASSSSRGFLCRGLFSGPVSVRLPVSVKAVRYGWRESPVVSIER